MTDQNQTARGVIEEAYLKASVDALLAEQAGNQGDAALYRSAALAVSKAYPNAVDRVHKMAGVGPPISDNEVKSMMRIITNASQ